MTAECEIKQIVKRALPKGKSFAVVWDPTGFGKSRILRVITPAWKTLPRFKRIMKIQKALDGSKLRPAVRNSILRVSVLTNDEYRRLQSLIPSTADKMRRPSKQQNGNRKLPRRVDATI